MSLESGTKTTLMNCKRQPAQKLGNRWTVPPGWAIGELVAAKDSVLRR